MGRIIFFAVVIVLGMSGAANAATYAIAGGNWVSQFSWNTNSAGYSNTYVYDNGEVGDDAFIAGYPNVVNWLPALPVFYDGTYSGSITTDGSGNVIGGTLSISGDIGYQLVTGAPISPSSWWAHTYTDLTLNFDTMTATAAAYQCHETIIAPATCIAGGADPVAIQFGLTAGAEGIDGAMRSAASFDGEVLSIFAENYSSLGPGTDYLNLFSLSATPVPVPTAIWLFGSALLGLGWIRYKK